ncbi:SRPBCC family protein [Chitinophaga sedimenti]|uniref:SRPBCC family protein n=1 Tax=Chitinophaga sedimenti TaxID=2033606 RepID=UPI00200679D3|nr:SRPBCC family protein [Chitinophaga sedimenti]MCK7555359.1 SRPBCC family protein [Chitinophaga sedimenti]
MLIVTYISSTRPSTPAHFAYRSVGVFSNPGNLAKITPPSMRFVVTSGTSAAPIYPGQIIEYTIRPLLGIKMYWMTEITHVKDGVYFVDEQRFGPYSLWHHQHHFREVAGGVEMTDIVHYRIPYGWIGDLANALFVGRQLREVFAFRKTAVEQLFPLNR